MKFLAKSPESAILAERLAYKKGAHNERLFKLLRAEQRGFCAYTEKRFTPLDNGAVEHFDPRLKGTAEDGYYNYYATLQSVNQRKRRGEAKHRDASFFTTRFFQALGAFERRIRYIVGEGIYEEIDPGDDEARALIDYLGLNKPDLADERRKHVKRLRDIFAAANWPTPQQIQHFVSHPTELSFPTAIAAELQLDLDPYL